MPLERGVGRRFDRQGWRREAGGQMKTMALLVAASWLACVVLSALAGAQTAAFDLNAAKAEYKRPPARPPADPALVDLGRILFWDPRISASGNTSCVSCHLPYLGWSVTDARSRSDSGKPTSRKSQPLIGIGHAEDSPVGWDGRSTTLEDQVRASIATGSMSMRQTDTPVKVEVIEARFRAIPEYVQKFAVALPGRPINVDAMATAISAYERTIEPGKAPFDRWIEGDEDAISTSAKRGFVLFNTKGNCAACHSGWRFTNDGFHDIGIATKDLGRGQQLKGVEAMQYAFKTPTLRSVALRPPYMHDGSVTRLYDVILHYEKGGIDRPSRSTEMFPLQLNEAERLDLVAFLQALTGVQEGEAPPKLPGLD
jgi:cytochrome c peroxidase